MAEEKYVYGITGWLDSSKPLEVEKVLVLKETAKRVWVIPAQAYGYRSRIPKDEAIWSEREALEGWVEKLMRHEEAAKRDYDHFANHRKHLQTLLAKLPTSES